MKRLTAFWLSALFLSPALLSAQSFIPERDTSATSLFEYATRIPRRNNAFNLNLEMHASFNTFFNKRRLDEAAFRFNHIKLEAAGEISDRLFYWYRQNLNQGNQGMELENLPESLEYAFVGYHISDRFTVTLGKQDAAWGGFEYDLNPFEIYEYSDMNEYLNGYLTGATLSFQATPSQEVCLQVTDNRVGSMEDTYGVLPAGTKKTHAPLFYTLNWNSSYWDEWLNLRYSVTAGEQAKGEWMYMAWAGHNVNSGPLDVYTDVLYTRGALDPLSILTELVSPAGEGGEGPVCLRDVQYLSVVAEINYRFHPRWNVFAKGMYETASLYTNRNGETMLPSGKYRTAWGCQAGIEFYPLAGDALYLFLNGTARTYSLTEKAKALGASIEDTQRLSLGFIYKVPLF